MGLDNPLHIAFLLVIMLLVFGARRLPEMGRSLGEGLRGFKSAINGDSSGPAIAAAHSDPTIVAAHPSPAMAAVHSSPTIIAAHSSPTIAAHATTPGSQDVEDARSVLEGAASAGASLTA
jgi:sec-independent protein translocase protein TatA